MRPDFLSQNLAGCQILDNFQINLTAVLSLQFSNVADHLLIFAITHKATTDYVFSLLTRWTLGRIVLAATFAVFCTFESHLTHQAVNSFVIGQWTIDNPVIVTHLRAQSTNAIVALKIFKQALDDGFKLFFGFIRVFKFGLPILVSRHRDWQCFNQVFQTIFCLEVINYLGKFFFGCFLKAAIFLRRRVESLRISSLFGEADSVSLNVESLSRDLSSCFDFLPGRSFKRACAPCSLY